ncbi:WhiB family transcriptional regulator [Dermatobacter hominis]|uniref:WhiB family transcriptional regulator n=1 Tax=Dermatobacter hominis TaxID=2884263 RepID=UPI001D12D09C|nr:WhiB family transcriptional regulator [Dermatobacter hominis]UDY35694.1 WhiB family transcriptional regulator [Dermatobacter hominis]
MKSLPLLLAAADDVDRKREEQLQHVAEALAVLLEAIGPEPAWQTEAACRGQTAVMFPANSGAKARALCASCAVLPECSVWAREQGTAANDGILAGTSPQERRRQRAVTAGRAAA